MRVKSDRIHRRFIGKFAGDSDFLINRKIKGIVNIQSKKASFPLPVFLLDALSLNLIQKAMTDMSGGYQFEWLSLRPYIIVTTMPSKNFNAVIQDNVVPK